MCAPTGCAPARCVVLGHYVLRGREMSVANSLIEAQPARVSPVPAETLYQFNESPLLARQSRQESNARSYPRRIPLALKRAKRLYVEDVEGRTFIDCLAGAGTLALGHNLSLIHI